MQNVTYPKGFIAWGLACQIKKNGKPDLGILVSEPPAQTFGVFTTNVFQAAPVKYDIKVLQSGKKISHVLVNSGNANACTGEVGDKNVLETASLLLEVSSAKGDLLISSTGVIGEVLPMEKLSAGIRRLFAKEKDYSPFHQAIMTTDTFEKIGEISLTIQGEEIRIGGAVKGAGMIRPNMATMLAYLTTDIALPASYQEKFAALVEKSFNSISVDGDMSTNDTALLLANGASGVNYVNLHATEQKSFDDSLLSLMQKLAKLIVRDGEGATKLVTIQVKSCENAAQAKTIAQGVANSPLVKTALFGGDPNWGRVVAAAGSCGVAFDPQKLDLDFCETPVLRGGNPASYVEKDVADKMLAKDISIVLNLHSGSSEWTYWTCDLTYDYVKINASYRS